MLLRAHLVNVNQCMGGILTSYLKNCIDEFIPNYEQPLIDVHSIFRKTDGDAAFAQIANL